MSSASCLYVTTIRICCVCITPACIMRDLLQILVCVGLFSTSAHGVFWDDFRGTYRENFPQEGYTSFPRTTRDAIANDWISQSLNCTNGGEFFGYRYMDSKEDFVALLYDVQGVIAGIQLVLPEDFLRKNSDYEFDEVPMYQSTDIYGVKYYLLTVYFIAPEKICNAGRHECDLQLEGTGTGLYFQNGNTKSFIQAPLNREDADSQGWHNHHYCVPGIGFHNFYHADSWLETKCRQIPPYYLIFTPNSQLLGFAFTIVQPVKNPRFEFDIPTLNNIVDVPGNPDPDLTQCFHTKGKSPGISTFHIFFNRDPWLLKCPADNSNDSQSDFLDSEESNNLPEDNGLPDDEELYEDFPALQSEDHEKWEGDDGEDDIPTVIAIGVGDPTDFEKPSSIGPDELLSDDFDISKLLRDLPIPIPDIQANVHHVHKKIGGHFDLSTLLNDLVVPELEGRQQQAANGGHFEKFEKPFGAPSPSRDSDISKFLQNLPVPIPELEAIEPELEKLDHHFDGAKHNGGDGESDLHPLRILPSDSNAGGEVEESTRVFVNGVELPEFSHNSLTRFDSNDDFDMPKLFRTAKRIPEEELNSHPLQVRPKNFELPPLLKDLVPIPELERRQHHAANGGQFEKFEERLGGPRSDSDISKFLQNLPIPIPELEAIEPELENFDHHFDGTNGLRNHIQTRLPSDSNGKVEESTRVFVNGVELPEFSHNSLKRIGSNDDFDMPQLLRTAMRIPEDELNTHPLEVRPEDFELPKLLKDRIRIPEDESNLAHLEVQPFALGGDFDISKLLRNLNLPLPQSESEAQGAQNDPDNEGSSVVVIVNGDENEDQQLPLRQSGKSHLEDIGNIINSVLHNSDNADDADSVEVIAF